MKITILLLTILLVGCGYESVYTFEESKVDSFDNHGVTFKTLSNNRKYILYEDFPLMRNANLYPGLPVVLACRQDGECEFH